MLDVPFIRVEPPGPKAREIIERDHDVLMQSFVRWYPLVVKTGRGAIVEDVDGNRYIDLNAGLAVLNVGHLHPKVVKAVEEQAKQLLHYSLTDFYYEIAVRVGEKIKSIMPFTGDSKLFYGNSGAETIEGSIKIARSFFGGARQYIIGFLGAFHGRTMGAVSITASKPVQRKGFAPLVPGVIHVPYPYSYRCPFQVETPEECGEAVLGYIEEWIFSKLVDPTEVAAFIIEPIQGEGGYIVPPDNFLPGLRRLADKHGILLIVDEVQSGVGRTGRWYAIEHWSVEPDIVASAKGIASGLPLGVIGGKAHIMKMPPGSHASTFGGNPVSLAAAEAVIEIIKEEKLLENAEKVGNYALERLKDLSDEIPQIGDVRGKGLMIGVEIVKDPDSKVPAREEVGNIIRKSFKRGVLVIGAGVSTIRLSPPLVITMEEMEKALDILEGIIREELKRRS
ncbi:MAG: acetyl ornithine aminotransferase family protein [Desulfurococcales archaeon]|nr:acetyl ornithine aminotransferase family protein [Desulfurococcales archaeon]